MKHLHKYIPIIVILPLIFACGPAKQNQAYYPPKPDRPVNDFADILNNGTETALDKLSRRIYTETGAALVIATIQSIAPANLETYANKLFEKWEIGEKGKDNGVLLLVAVKERKTRIEVGYGLEGAIPDAKAYAVYKNILVPAFRAGDFNRGITRAAEALAGMIADEYGVKIPDLEKVSVPATGREETSLPGILGGIVTVILFILFFGLRLGLFGAILMGSGRRRGGFWYGGGSSGGGFSGGFGGFGGGMSGGGGAGGGW